MNYASHVTNSTPFKYTQKFNFFTKLLEKEVTSCVLLS